MALSCFCYSFSYTLPTSDIQTVTSTDQNTVTHNPRCNRLFSVTISDCFHSLLEDTSSSILHEAESGRGHIRFLKQAALLQHSSQRCNQVLPENRTFLKSHNACPMHAARVSFHPAGREGMQKLRLQWPKGSALEPRSAPTRIEKRCQGCDGRRKLVVVRRAAPTVTYLEAS